MTKTSWERVAPWYDELLKGDDTYQLKVILPQLERLMEIKRGEAILDLACGQGFFSNHFEKAGGEVIGVDASRQLIARAKEAFRRVKFYVGQADKLSFIKNKTVDKVAIILAIQNIQEVGSVFKECARVMKSGGRLFIVMNHPSFRIPKASGWGWDEEYKTQYRRIDQYLSESKVKIQMHPGDDPDSHTLSFHRPLQFYFKTLKNNGFLVRNVEEWESHKKSQPGPRAKAEDKARKEIPLFLFLEAVKSE